MEQINRIKINNVEYMIVGKSAYDSAVANGFEGTEEEWLESLAKEANTFAKEHADLAEKSANKAVEEAEKAEEARAEVEEARAEVEEARAEVEEARVEVEAHTPQQIHNWLDEHPEATTTVQDNSLGVSKFTDDAKHYVIKDYATPEMYGAKGDGVTDDTEAVMRAVTEHRSVRLSKKYLITKPIKLGSYAHIFGGGEITKTSDTTVNDTKQDINACFVLTGMYTTISNLLIYGDIANKAGGIAIATNARHIHIENVNIRNAQFGVKSFAMTFMNVLKRVHVRGCEAGFDFYSDKEEKTSLSLDCCYAENCGLPYAFYGVCYFTISNCGADMCNWKGDDNLHGDGGHGDKATALGVYTFRQCRAVNILGCGTEKSYGNGAVHLMASQVNINGLYVVNLKSEYTPDYTNYPKYGVGVIVTTQEKSWLHARNVFISAFTNENATIKSIIAWNYHKNTYGEINERVCTAERINITGNTIPLYGGMGYNNIICGSADEINPELGYSKKYCARELAYKTGGNKLIIPVTSDPNNYRHNIIKVSGCGTALGSNAFHGFECTIGVTSLDTVRAVVLLSQSDAGIVVSKSGQNVILTLPNTGNDLYTTLTVSGEIIGRYNNLVEWENVALT